jgi:hypothetical protein
MRSANYFSSCLFMTACNWWSHVVYLAQTLEPSLSTAESGAAQIVGAVTVFVLETTREKLMTALIR